MFFFFYFSVTTEAANITITVKMETVSTASIQSPHGQFRLPKTVLSDCQKCINHGYLVKFSKIW
uniref:Hypothetical secreted peptide n=1 Tax=Glossina morsitans morsitans TaxID=37546 RepID=D3TSH5_GLOMM